MQEIQGIDKRSVLVGFVGGILVLCTIGFFILLGVLLSKGEKNIAYARNTQTDQVVAAPTNVPNPANVQVDPVKDDEHIRGNKKALITLVEYSDTECPFCKKYHETLKEILADSKYNSKVRWVYRDFPLRQLHSRAAKEAEAIECAADLGGNDVFWKYLDQIFEKTGSNDSLDPGELPKIAENVGLSRAKFESCLSNGRMAGVVSAFEQSGTAAGVQGTPHSILLTKDGKKVPFSGALPAQQIRQIIDSVLQS